MSQATTVTEVQTPCSTDADCVTDYPVYAVFSQKPLGWIENKICTCVNASRGALVPEDVIGSLQIVYDRFNRETNMAVAVLSNEAYEALCRQGYDMPVKSRTTNKDDLRVVKYELKDGHFPREGYSYNLHVPLPQELQSRPSEAVDIITGKLEHLVDWGILPADSFALKTPLKSREGDGVSAGCFIVFSDNVEQEAIALTRILLNNTYWYDPVERSKNRLYLYCDWARERTDKRKYHQTSHHEQSEVPEDPESHAVRVVNSVIQQYTRQQQKPTFRPKMDSTEQPKLK